MIGVEYDLFWTLNPKSLSPFVKAFDLKRKYDDYVSWTNGLYVQRAIASCLGKNQKYPKKPFFDKSEQKLIPMSPDEIKEKMFEQMKKINARFRKDGV